MSFTKAYLGRKLAESQPGNRLSPGLAASFVIPFALLLFADVSTGCFVIAWLMMGNLIVTRFRFYLDLDLRQMVFESYNTDMHLPIWADLVGYGLWGYAAYRIHSLAFSVAIGLTILLEIYGRVGGAFRKRVTSG